MANPLSVSDTVSQMTGISSATLNWDVIVNYSEPAINKLLATRYKEESRSATQLTNLKFHISVYDPDSGKLIPIEYDLSLGAPLISFNARGAEGPTCNLAFPITGGTAHPDGGEAETISADLYTVTFRTLFLATAQGTVNPTPKPSDQLFVFPDDGKRGSVIIDLPASKDLTVILSIDKSSKATHSALIDYNIPDIEAAIVDEYHSSGKYKDIYYEIARVDSHPPPSGSIELQPISFRFDAFLPSDDPQPTDVGVLTLFIQTRNLNHGTQSNLGTAWEDQWRVSLKCSPIPKGETASIIFSKNMIYDSVIKPALVKQGFSGKGLSDTTGSLEVQIDTGKEVHRAAFDKTDPPSGCQLGGTEYKADSIDVILPPLSLTFKEISGSPTYVTSWQYEYTCAWTFTKVTLSGDWNSPVSRATNGKTTATHTFPKDPNQHPKVVTFLDDYSLTMDCSVSKDNWKVDFKAEHKTAW